jgi:DNA-binding response OmpR family regulator
MRLLVVEDERKVARALKEGLEAEQYDVVVEHTGEAAYFRLTTEPFDLLLLDVTLPGRSGLEVLTAIRKKNVTIPTLVLTARHTVHDRVAGLNAGADDYLVKPFGFAELLARIRVLVRRGHVGQPLRITAGALSVDLQTHRATLQGQPIALTTLEFELLACLMRHQGQVVPREALTREVWKESARTTPLENAIDVHMARLRRKVDCDESAKLIHTVRGIGFILRAGEP